MKTEQAIEEIVSYRNEELPFVTKESLGVALEALKEKYQRENPQPLTLEELKERIGKPVYMIKDVHGEWERTGGWEVLVDVTSHTIWFKYNTERVEYVESGRTCIYDHEPKDGRER